MGRKQDRWWTVGSTVEHKKTGEYGTIQAFRGGRIGNSKQGAQKYRVEWVSGGVGWVDRKHLRLV